MVQGKSEIKAMAQAVLKVASTQLQSYFQGSSRVIAAMPNLPVRYEKACQVL